MGAEENHREAQTQQERGLHNDVIGDKVESERGVQILNNYLNIGVVANGRTTKRTNWLGHITGV